MSAEENLKELVSGTDSPSRPFRDEGMPIQMKFEIYPDGGNFRWRLVSSNGETVASSGESFASKSHAREAAENVKAKAGSADVVDG